MLSKDKICQVCKEQLKASDDIVVCPVCGAPYHRECYNNAGKCVYEELHSTNFEYKPQTEDEQTISQNEEKAVCINCGHKFENDENFCPNCRTPKDINLNFSFGYDKATADYLEKTDSDGVSASSVKAFSLINANRYVNKYFSLDKSSKKSWNWAAFLVPEGWFFYRKMYKAGIVVILLMIISAVCLIPFNAALVLPDQRVSSYEMVEIMTKALTTIQPFALAMAWIGSTINILIRIFCGLFGDYIYKCFTKEKLLNYKPKNREEESIPLFVRLSRLGGVQPFMFLAGYLMARYIPQIIQYFIV